MSRSHHAGTSPVHRYLNGRMLDGQRGSDMEPDATAGLLQNAGSGPEDEDDGPTVPTTVADGPAANESAPSATTGSATVAGNQLNASGTEISLDGVRAAAGSNAAPGSGKGGGGGATSTASLKSAWKLKYQDFLPDKKGAGANNFNPISSEHFQKLVDRANDWLDKNRDVQVKTCQTLTWMSHDIKRLGSGEQMVLSKNFCDNSTTYFVRGLRLWLVPRTQMRRQQSINFTDFTPDGPTDTIKNLVAKVNKKIDSKQLKGHILTVETFNGPILNGKFDSRITRWTESINDDAPHAFAIRVFHCRQGGGSDGNSGPGSHHSKHSNVMESSHIDIRDVVPQATDDGYEGFEDLVERTNTWLKDQSDILVINMQSIMVQKDDSDPHSETGNACYYVVPGLNSASPVDFFRILRIAYRQPTLPDTSAKAATDLDLPVIYPFTYETFTPELVRVGFNTAGSTSGGKLVPPPGPGSAKERLETMNETFSKVMAFLQNSGADVICAEMVSNPMQLYASDSTALSGPDEIQFLLTIRLFLTGQICRVDGSMASIKRASIVSCRGAPGGGTKNSSRGGGVDRDDRPGPIFLRSVVTRQFKYRWLVLAISAFFSMAVIVALSVIYSNR